MARVWWAERNPELLIALQDGTFDQLLENLPQHRADTPETYANILSRFLEAMEEDNRHLALRVFENTMTTMNAEGPLADLRRRRNGTESRPQDEDQAP